MSNTKRTQRTIKFRAWDGEDMIHDIGIRSGMAIHLDTGKMHDWPLMQYTGLSDKDGQEIYDGDVMIMSKHSDGKPEPVYMNESTGTWKCGRFGELHSAAMYGIVIGNIYENPKLYAAEAAGFKPTTP